MKVKIIANKAIHPQQMPIDKYVGKIINAYAITTIYGVGDDKDGTFILLDGEYEIIKDKPLQ